MATRTSPRLLLLAAGSLACGDRDDPSGSTGTITVTGIDSGESVGDGDGDDEGEKLDVGGEGSGEVADEGGEQGCRGVDFLFVVDNSGSMQDEQNNLIGSFPGFMTTIQQTLQDQAQDFHVLVTDTDAVSDICVQLCMQFPNLVCNGIPCMNLPPPGSDCDSTLGAGRVQNAMGQDCGITSGKRYIDNTQPNISQTFSCLGAVGTQGDGAERQIQALIAAISPALTDPGECNEEFLRSDAILVVTFITDEEDSLDDPAGGTPGDPVGWHASVLSAKGGDELGVVVLGLFGDVGEPNAICQALDPNAGTGAEASPRLKQFVELFGVRGLWGSVCAPDYNPFFQEAVSLIDTTCDDYVPPG
jgi:hypothetical protein